MEENEYRKTYEQVSELRCVFEKALTAQQACCSLSRHFYLGDREGYGCQNEIASRQCAALLKQLREKGRFVLGLTDASAPLPHNKEIRIQIGGLRGLSLAVDAQEASLEKPEIRELVRKAQALFEDFEALPFTTILPEIVSFAGRKKRRRK